PDRRALAAEPSGTSLPARPGPRAPLPATATRAGGRRRSCRSGAGGSAAPAPARRSPRRPGPGRGCRAPRGPRREGGRPGPGAGARRGRGRSRRWTAAPPCSPARGRVRPIAAKGLICRCPASRRWRKPCRPIGPCRRHRKRTRARSRRPGACAWGPSGDNSAMDENPAATPDDPLYAEALAEFRRLFDAAAAAGEPDRTAMTLATATLDARPSARTVLLKAFDPRGFVFYTHLDGRKGRELQANPYAALLFHWPRVGDGVQVRIEGRVHIVP